MKLWLWSHRPKPWLWLGRVGVTSLFVAFCCALGGMVVNVAFYIAFGSLFNALAALICAAIAIFELSIGTSRL